MTSTHGDTVIPQELSKCFDGSRRVSGKDRHKRPTLAMVASASGVSLPTVSKVLNGRADVAADTRARVESALREHNYVPPASRRPPSAARTIDLVFDDIVG